MTVKLLLLDEDEQLLMVQGRDPLTRTTHWYPVGGGIEPGESAHEAACREAHEETGLTLLAPGLPVWTRDHTYEYDGHSVEVHEDWFLHAVGHFDPAPAGMSDYESRSIIGFRWWGAEELSRTEESVYPPNLGTLLTALLREGLPSVPVDISDRSAT